MNNGRGQQVPDCDNVPSETTPLLRTSSTERYSVFSTTQKRLIILAAALASAFSPLSANIYYPALNSIAKELHVSPSKINLTITTYMVCYAAVIEAQRKDRAEDYFWRLDMSRNRPDVHRFACRPGRTPASLHLLFRHLHCRQYRACTPALVPCTADSARRPKLWQ